MAYYYINPDDQNYPPNYPYYNQPHYIDQYHHNTYYYYSDSSSYDDQSGYGSYSNEEYPVRYNLHNQYYNTQFHSNPYQHLPTRSLIACQYNSASNDHIEFPAKTGSNLLDPDVTTGFVLSYSNTEPQIDLEFEGYNPEPFQGGYKMDEAYGKPLPPSEDICYPPSKSDLTPPPPSPFGKVDTDLDTPPVKKEENVEDVEDEDDDDEGLESEGDEEDDEEEEEEQEKQEENRGELIAPPLPGKVDQSIGQGDAKPANGSIVNEQPREEDEASKLEQQQVEEEEEDEDEDEDEEEEEEEEEKRYYTWDDGKVEEKETRQQIPPGTGMETLDLCDRVFGGYFPCWRKRNQGSTGADQGGSTDAVSYGNEETYRECWKTTMDYLFGDPNPYAQAMPDPIYGYQRYYPQQPICEQVEYGGYHTYTLSDDSTYYGHNGAGY